MSEINDLADTPTSGEAAAPSAGWRSAYSSVIDPDVTRTFRWLLWIGLILLLTVPWDLQNHPHWYKVAWRPFVGIVRPLDLLLNFVLYLPFGAWVPLRRDRLIVVGLLAAILSGGCELSQVWSHWRFPSTTDFVMNTLGAVAGRLWRKRAVT